MPYTESFNQADSSTIGPDQTWTKLYGAFDTVSNELRGPATTHGRIRCDQTVTIDHYSEAVFTNTNLFPGVAVRYYSTSDRSCTVLFRSTATLWRLRTYTDSPGTFTNISSFTQSVGSTFTLRLEVVGDEYKSYVDGTLHDTTTNTTRSDSGRTYAGIFIYDNTARADSFETDSLSASSFVDNTTPIMRHIMVG